MPARKSANDLAILENAIAATGEELEVLDAYLGPLQNASIGGIGVVGTLAAAVWTGTAPQLAVALAVMMGVTLLLGSLVYGLYLDRSNIVVRRREQRSEIDRILRGEA